MSSCTLVIGAPRSGTSCVAGVLHHLGVRMSLGPFPAPTPINPAGFFEDAEISFLTTGYARGDDRGRRDARLRAAVEARCAAGVAWGAKSYGLAYCLPQFLDCCPVPVRVVRVVRPVAHSAASAAKAFGRGDHVREIFARVTEAVAGAGAPVLTVEYAALLADPAAGVAAIAAFAGVPPTAAAAASVVPTLRTVP